MAKVTMPLMSGSASGQIAKGIVFAGWKGIQYVRKYVIPANPMSTGQGDYRILMGGAGRVAGKVTVAGDINAQFGVLGVVPAGQSKQSYLVKYILNHLLNIKVTPTAYSAIQALYVAHTAKAGFDSEAAALGLTTFDVDYATETAMTGGCQLYILATALIAIGLTGEPYATALASWDLAKIQAMVADL